MRGVVAPLYCFLARPGLRVCGCDYAFVRLDKLRAQFYRYIIFGRPRRPARVETGRCERGGANGCPVDSKHAYRTSRMPTTRSHRRGRPSKASSWIRSGWCVRREDEEFVATTSRDLLLLWEPLRKTRMRKRHRKQRPIVPNAYGSDGLFALHGAAIDRPTYLITKSHRAWRDIVQSTPRGPITL